jgi:SNF2 family DNA or RNA helicase
VLKVVNIDMSAKEALGYQAICGKGSDPQLPNGFQTIAREALVDLHFAIHKVGDFQGDLSSKVAYLVKAMNERIEEFKRVHWDNVDMQPKVVIYVHWEQMVSTIACHLARNGISTSILTGQQSETERETVISQFQQAKSHMSQALFGPKKKVHVHGDTSSDVQLDPSVKCRTLIVTDVGMTGLNLQQADTLFFLDLPRKKGFLNQAMARACRYGQTRTVTAHLLVAKNTLDTYT